MAGPTFLDLPREVRDQILEEVVSDGSLGDACFEMRKKCLYDMRKISPKDHDDLDNGNEFANFVPFVVAQHPVLAVSKQLHDEGLDNLLRTNAIIKENYPLGDEPGKPAFIDMLKQMGEDRAKRMSVGLMPISRHYRGEGGTFEQDEKCLGYLKQAEQDWDIPKGRLFYELRYKCLFLVPDAQGFPRHRGGSHPVSGLFEGKCTIRIICGDVAASMQKLEEDLQSFAIEYAGESQLDINMKMIRQAHESIICAMADIWQ